jgi:hypothetical protein
MLLLSVAMLMQRKAASAGTACGSSAKQQVLVLPVAAVQQQ